MMEALGKWLSCWTTAARRPDQKDIEARVWMVVQRVNGLERRIRELERRDDQPDHQRQ